MKPWVILSLLFPLLGAADRDHDASKGTGTKRAEADMPACTFDWLTNKCEVFENTNRKRFEFPDGTSISNPIPDIKKRLSAPAMDRYAESERLLKDSKKLDRELNAELHEISVQISKMFHEKDPEHEAMALETKQAITQNFLALEPILSGTQTEITVDWPISAPTKQTVVPREDFLKGVSEAITEQGLEQLKTLVTKAKKAHQTYESEVLALKGKEKEPTAEFKKEREKRTGELFKIAQSKMIEIIRNGKRDTELSESQKSAIKRVETIRFLGVDPEEARTSPFCQQGPNGFYSPTMHAFTVCNGMSWVPDNSLLAVIGHELAHSIDPCSSQFDLYSWEPSELGKLVQDGKLADEATQSLEHIGLTHALLTNADHPTPQPIIAGPLPIIYSQKALDFMTERGVLNIQAKGIPSDEALFKDVVNCLNSPEHGGFKRQNPAALSARAERVAKFRETRFGADYKTEQNRVQQALQRYPECAIGGDHSEMSEAFADWMGAKVLGKHLGETLKETKLSTPLDRLSVAGDLAVAACAELVQYKHRANDTLGAQIDAALEDLAHSQDPHPASRSRIENILLKDPGIRAALGCSELPSCGDTWGKTK